MPWTVRRDSRCPDSKPFAVINKETGANGGRCHESKQSAVKQLALLASKERRNELRELSEEEIQALKEHRVYFKEV